jgi:outer membrane lipoprotein-sorting protein
MITCWKKYKPTLFIALYLLLVSARGVEFTILAENATGNRFAAWDGSPDGRPQAETAQPENGIERLQSGVSETTSPAVNQEDKRKQAEAIIEKTAKCYRQWKGMYIAFAANMRSDANGVAESFEGTIRMKKDKFILQTPDRTTWFDGVTQWTYVLQGDEVNISAPSGAELRYLNPMLLLNDYQKDFDVSYIGESTSGNAKAAYDVALTPKKKDDIEKIELQIEKNTSLPAKIVVTMKRDIRSVFTIRTIREEAFPDATFTFPEANYPNAEMIDLR